MLRLLILATGLAIMAPAALAQGGARILPVPGVKHAGTLHLATGTWTRGPRPVAPGASDVLYDNTCSGAWYTALEQQTFHDDGRLPSTSSPQIDQGAFGSGTWMATSFPGTRDTYEIHGYQIAYCTYSPPPVSAVQFFYECYVACSDATQLSPTAGFHITGLPGSGYGVGGIGCWIVDIDLLGTTLEFAMNADCDGSWDGQPELDNFGYAHMQVTADPWALSGPILAGDPDGLLLDGPGTTGCCVGCNTVFWAGSNVPGTSVEGSGLNAHDFFEADDHLGGLVFRYNGCFWFLDGYSANAPHADIHFRIGGDADGSWPPFTAYCFGHTAQGNPCPCSNDNDQSDSNGAGCANGTFAAGARLRASGLPSVSGDSLVLHGARGQPNNTGLFFQALNDLDGGGAFLGDGIRCAGGLLKRMKVQSNDANGDANTSGTVISVRSAQLGDLLSPGDVRRYQWWYRDTGNPPCGPGVNDSNTSNGLEIHWQP